MHLYEIYQAVERNDRGVGNSLCTFSWTRIYRIHERPYIAVVLIQQGVLSFQFAKHKENKSSVCVGQSYGI